MAGGHAEMQQRTSEPETTRLRSMLTRQTRTLTRMVDDLLDISRITSGKIRLEKEPIALGPVISLAVESTRSLMESRRHELIVSEPDAPLRIEADATRLEQILVNLLSNAAKYTNPGGRIHLVAEEENGEVCLMVRDNGIGISAEMLSGVFGMFTQVDQSLQRTQGGLGIGLALVRSPSSRCMEARLRPKAPARAKAASLSCGCPWERCRSKFRGHRNE